MRREAFLLLLGLPFFAGCFSPKAKGVPSLNAIVKKEEMGESRSISFANNIASFSFANDLGPLTRAVVYKNSFTLTSPINQGVIIYMAYTPEGGNKNVVAGNEFEITYLQKGVPCNIDIQIPKALLTAPRGVFFFNLAAITGDFTGREWTTSFALERSNKNEGLIYHGEESIAFPSYVLKWNAASETLEDAPLSFGFVGDEGARKRILEQSGSTSNSILLSHPDVFFRYRPSNHAVSFHAEFRITSNVGDFPNLPRNGKIIKLPLKGVVKGGGVYSLSLKDTRYFSRKTLRLSDAKDPNAFPSNSFFVPTGLGKRKHRYTFELVFTSVGKFLNQITVFSGYVANQENFGSFADGDYYLHGGAGE